MKLIVCVDEKNGIGCNGKLLYSIPEDMKFFREKTKDSILVMGLNTLMSFKDHAPLKGRINIVFAPNKNEMQEKYEAFDNIIFIDDKNEINKIAAKYPTKDVYVIGGASIYEFLYKNCDTLYITKMYKTFENCDTYFPNIEEAGFKITEKSEIFTHHPEDKEGNKSVDNIKYQFLTYTK